MSCEDSSAATDRYKYSHNDTATIRLYSSPTGSRPWSLNSRVLLESTSTLRSSTPIFHQQNGIWGIRKDATLNGTPFSVQVLELLSRYPLQRLIIRVGDAAASSGGTDKSDAAGADGQQLRQEERARGPAGTSILASFTHSSDNDINENEVLKSYYQNQYASLLRYLLDNALFPPCGAPLDSLRVRKHGHSLIVRAHASPSYEEDHSTLETVDVESFLAADGATFCNPGINSFILSQREHAKAGIGWGAAANNGACHSSDKWGLFDSLFSTSSGVILSELLIGTSRDSTPWMHGENANKRNSVWIDLQVSPKCFASISGYAKGEECTLSVTRGVSYRVAMPSHSQTIATDENDKYLTLSLGDLLVGHHTLQHSRSSQKEELKAWYPCPMSDSSRVVMYLPKGYAAKLEDANNPHSTTGFNDERWREGRMEFNLLALRDGFIDLAAPWTMLSHIDENNIADQYPLLYGISRTVQRPSGISSSGTMVSVLRYETIQSDSDKPNIVTVKSLDVLPGAIIKPRMRSLSMTLYQGGGAGGTRFVPPLVDHQCQQLQSNETMPWSIDGTIYKKCGSVHVTQLRLAQLEDHRLTLHPDGTILLERTTFLQPDSSLWMMVDFDEAYLPFQKFPADANRGVDIFPSQATFTPVIASSSFEAPSSPSITLYSSSLVILPPVPDMSMPFNVISLSCTLWAFVLGSLLNTLVRRGTESVKRELTGEKEKRPIDKLREKIKDKVGKLRGALRRIVGDKATTGESKPSVNTEISSRNE
ncbi:hypothetical protein ACHAWU_001660 [Discostella pseudostelligera]|uniref:GPI transamidase component PIG-T n=1 Tax=Discostella pseudostelligera TaxID=259834 RepID=A0ABD3MF16_9STRA